jgi:hypothetical protein
MRTMLVLGGVLFLAACGGNPNVPPKVSYGYGAGNGDPIPFSGPAPQYSFGSGLGNGDPVAPSVKPTVSRGYGAEQFAGAGVMEQTTPAQPQQQYAAPSQTQHPAIAPATSSHL